MPLAAPQQSHINSQPAAAAQHSHRPRGATYHQRTRQDTAGRTPCPGSWTRISPTPLDRCFETHTMHTLDAQRNLHSRCCTRCTTAGLCDHHAFEEKGEKNEKIAEVGTRSASSTTHQRDNADVLCWPKSTQPAERREHAQPHGGRTTIGTRGEKAAVPNRNFGGPPSHATAGVPARDGDEPHNPGAAFHSRRTWAHRRVNYPIRTGRAVAGSVRVTSQALQRGQAEPTARVHGASGAVRHLLPVAPVHRIVEAVA